MVTVDEARRLIQAALPTPRAEEAVLARALGRVAAKEIFARSPLPSFDNSAMDGFAVRSMDLNEASPEHPVRLSIGSSIMAGYTSGLLGPGFSKRIMTGAPMPASADAVIPIEEAVLEKNYLVVSQPVVPGRHVRYTGEEIKKGDAVLKPGETINPGTIGFLSALGVVYAVVYRKPRVAVVSTGSELVDAGGRLGPGKIYDSNGPMLRAALEAAGVPVVSVRRVQDRPMTMRLALASALARADVVIVSGGVSAGQADFAKDVLAKLGVGTVLWGVNQKPGKPFYVGKKGARIVFGLPGNPASVFTCFYEYVYPSLRRLMGFNEKELFSERLPLAASLGSSSNKTLFLKARRIRTPRASVELLPRQASHMLSPLRQADSFVVIPQDTEPLPAGGAVLVHALPYAQSTHS